MSEGKTFDKMTFKELLQAYNMLIDAFTPNEEGKKRYNPDDPGYHVVEARLENIETEIEKRKPGYLKKLEDKSIYENILDDNYTINQVAEIFNITRQTVYNWMKISILPFKKIGGKMYFSKKAVERMIKNGSIEKARSI